MLVAATVGAYRPLIRCGGAARDDPEPHEDLRSPFGHRAWTAALAVVVAVSAACGGGGGDAPAEPTVPTGPSSTLSTTTTVDVSVIPPVIDEPYLNRVLAALDEVDGQATRVIVANRSLVPEAAEILNAVYDDEEFAQQADVWLDTIINDPELATLKPNPGNRKTIVKKLISASPSCVWLAVERDYSETAAVPPENTTEYVALRPKDPSNDPKNRNPTAWMIDVDGSNEDGSEPANQCAGS